MLCEVFRFRKLACPRCLRLRERGFVNYISSVLVKSMTTRTWCYHSHPLRRSSVSEVANYDGTVSAWSADWSLTTRTREFQTMSSNIVAKGKKF